MRLINMIAASLLLSFLCPRDTIAQKKIIVVIGSSTAEGVGASTPDSSYVMIVQRYYQALGLIDTIYDLGLSGTTTYYGMPDGYIPPAGRPFHSYGYNVTAALQLGADIVLVNYPSNDIVDGYSMSEFLSNLDTIYNTVIAAGKICYVTTTQPLDYHPVDTLELLRDGRDSILLDFSVHSIDFYDPLVASDSLTINPLYYVDGTHVNNAGHRALAQAVIARNILSGMPLALSLTAFAAVPEPQGVLITWTDLLEEANTVFGIQRSADGSVFSTIATENGKGTDGNGTITYDWTDEAPLDGRSFYRLEITEGVSKSYSRVVTVTLKGAGLSIRTIYSPGGPGLFTVDINAGIDQSAMIRIFNAAGVIVWQQPNALIAPTTRLSLDLTRFAKGAYFLQVIGANGEQTVRGFPDF